MVTIISSAKPNQPRTIAVTPTPVATDPFPMFSAMVAAATLAVCCHSTETSTKIAATNITASATWDTARLGSRFLSGPPSYSSSYPGKVARRSSVTAARIIAIIKRYGKTMLSLNVWATHIRFRGSWSTLTCAAREEALALHNQEDPSGFIQIPKYLV